MLLACMIIDAQDRDGTGIHISCFLTVILEERGAVISFVANGSTLSFRNILFYLFHHV
jgi:hypothetical protein